MESRVPIVSDSRHIKACDAVESMRSDFSDGRIKKAESALARLRASNLHPDSDPVVASRLLSAMRVHSRGEYASAASGILEGVDQYHPSVMLTIVEFSLDDGDVETANRALSRVSATDDMFRYEFVTGRVLRAMGDPDGARERYWNAFRADPYNLGLYPELDVVDPGRGWDSFMDIISVRLGGEASSSSLEGGMSELSAIYSGWVGGDRVNSMRALEGSRQYADDDPFYHLVHAWMLKSDGRFRKAVRSYIKAADGFGGSARFLAEAADLQDRMGQYEEAIASCHRALETDPFSSSAIIQMSIAFHHMGEIREAMSAMDSLTSRPGVDARECARFIDSLWEGGRRDEAEHVYKRVGPKSSDRVYRAFLASVSANRRGRAREALKAAEEGLKVDPNSIPCICQKAVALADSKSPVDALNYIRSKRPVFRDDIRLLFTEKDILRSASRHKEAITVCDNILSLRPRDADVMRDKADSYFRIESYPESIAVYRESLNIREDMRLFASVLRMLFDRGLTDELCSLVDDYDDTYGESAAVWRIRGNAEYGAGRYEEAASSYSRASMVVTNDIDIWYSRGMAEERAGRYADAEASYDRAVILDLSNADSWIAKAAVQEKQGNIVGAINSLNMVISTASDNIYAMVMKGRLLAGLGRYREARFFLELAYKVDPSNTRVLSMIMRILLREGDYASAVEVGKVLAKKDGSPGNMLDLAEAHFGSGDRDSAIRIINDVQPLVRDDAALSIRCADAYDRLMCYVEELGVYNILREGHPDERGYHMRAAELYATIGDRDSASEIYRMLESMNPGDSSIAARKAMVESDAESPASDAGAMTACARSLAESGRMEEAADVMAEVVSSCPDDPEHYVFAADTMIGSGRLDDALSAMEQAAGAFPADARVMFMLGEARRLSGDDAGALSAYGDASGLGMSNHDLHLRMGEMQLGLGMLSPATANLKASVESDPSDDEARKMLVEALLKAGRGEEAVPHLLCMMQSGGGSAWALTRYVSLFRGTGDSESILSVYSLILSAERTEGETAYFKEVLNEMGEHSKADALDPAPPEPYDARVDAVRVLDEAHASRRSVSDPAVYSDLGLSDEEMEAILDAFTSPMDYVPEYGSETFDRLESLSRDLLLSKSLESCSDPLPVIRAATGSDSISEIRTILKHMEFSDGMDAIAAEFAGIAESVASRASDLEDPSKMSIMRELGVGPVAAAAASILLKG